MLLIFVVGETMDENFRRAMLLTHGDLAVFFTRPISRVPMVAAALVLLMAMIPAFPRMQEEALKE